MTLFSSSLALLSFLKCSLTGCIVQETIIELVPHTRNEEIKRKNSRVHIICYNTTSLALYKFTMISKKMLPAPVGYNVQSSLNMRVAALVSNYQFLSQVKKLTRDMNIPKANN